MSVLSVKDISKKYKFREVVKGISLEINSGEVVGLLGSQWGRQDDRFLHDRRPGRIRSRQDCVGW